MDVQFRKKCNNLSIIRTHIIEHLHNAVTGIINIFVYCHMVVNNHTPASTFASVKFSLTVSEKSNLYKFSQYQWIESRSECWRMAKATEIFCKSRKENCREYTLYRFHHAWMVWRLSSWTEQFIKPIGFKE